MINNSMNKHQLHWIRVNDIIQLSCSTFRAYVSAVTMVFTETLQKKCHTNKKLVKIQFAEAFIFQAKG